MRHISTFVGKSHDTHEFSFTDREQISQERVGVRISFVHLEYGPTESGTDGVRSSVYFPKNYETSRRSTQQEIQK